MAVGFAVVAILVMIIGTIVALVAGSAYALLFGLLGGMIAPVALFVMLWFLRSSPFLAGGIALPPKNMA